MRRIVCLRILERDPTTDQPVPAYEYPFPDLPDDAEPATRQELLDLINNQELHEHEKLCMLNKISFALDSWHRLNFYEIGKMDWKYD